MHAFSVVTLGIFVAGYSTARWDLVTRLYELAIFAWDHGVVVCWNRASAYCTPPLTALPRQTRAAKAVAVLSVFFLLVILPVERLAAYENDLHPRTTGGGISAREQLKRRGSF
jgi:hypothetical protein